MHDPAPIASRTRSLHRWLQPWAAVAAAAALAVPTAGCGSCEGEAAMPAASSAGREEPAKGSKPTEPSGESSAIERDDEPTDPPPVTVTAVIEDAATVSASIRAREATRLAPEVTVEHHDGQGWAAVAALSLRFDCEEKAPTGCVALERGAELLPPPWLGRKGKAQCSCEDCAEAEPGRYRFLVRGCGGGPPVTGEPFELPAR